MFLVTAILLEALDVRTLKGSGIFGIQLPSLGPSLKYAKMLVSFSKIMLL